ncbi:hypothetical protein ACVCIC_25260 [Burkholderia glumae]|uniref:hypothetical protein n=1 Tax=Burkholderia glumae TaxID=337 RepID=UPI001F32AB68|nr:hypothetical protein [Burkholderia glumae]MCM2544876.1 hypothetical protein [Burkholderia glumae]MCQ0029692.1 hypothetical protein [Burkholderia glumae]MCQ0035506.1 hypothetical protein [Burkholderia glumae]
MARPPIYRLLSVPEKIYGKHVNHVWKGLAGIPGANEPGIPVVVKYLPNAAQLDIELACGLASQVLKLPVPAPGLVIAEAADLPECPSSLQGQKIVLFGSLFQTTDPIMARHSNEGESGEEHIWSSVCFDDTGRLGATWDELVANPDRHAQNLIFDGVKWWLFDHNLALSPVSKIYEALADPGSHRSVIEHTARVNRLLDQLIKRRPEDHGIEDEAAKFAKQVQRLKILAFEMGRWSVPGGPKISEIVRMAATIVGLIALRLEPLQLYVAQRLKKPSAEALWTESMI